MCGVSPLHEECKYGGDLRFTVHSSCDRFQWVDGALTKAVETGSWVLLDSANLCNPTVLDRLNPLLEPSGELLLNECGAVGGKPRIIRPHADFRLFLALDPRHGEVSRAMRNRGVELFLLPPDSAPTAGPSQSQVSILMIHPIRMISNRNQLYCCGCLH